MKSLAEEIKELQVAQGSVGIVFLGQAGFLFKTSKGKRIVVDPYLSDSCNRIVGFKRLMPFLISADEIEADYLLISHEHPDHFDTDSMPSLVKEKTKCFMAEDCRSACEKMGFKNVAYMQVGDTYVDAELRLTAVACDHGASTPYALGFLLEVEGKRIYLAGDTCYREDIFNQEFLFQVDAFIFPINGAYGNLNGKEAGVACAQIKPKLAIPCHYWNFAQHLGNPIEFMETMDTKHQDVDYCMMRQGESIII